MNRNHFVLLILAAALTTMLGASAAARTLTVGKSDAEYSSIQVAIFDAEEGDVIQVGPGVYQETIRIATDGLRLVGSGAGESVIESPHVVITYLGIDGGSLEGFTLRHVGEGRAPAILLHASSPTISDNDIMGATLAGLEVGEGASPVLERNIIRANRGNGVLVHSRSSVTMTENRIHQNGLEARLAGVEIRGGATALLERNVIWLNGGSGVLAYDSAQATVTGNSIMGNGLNGVSVQSGAACEVASNSILWNAQIGIYFNAAQEISLDANLVSHHLLGLMSVGDTRVLSQTSNLMLQNVTDAVGIGISPEDNQMNANALFHPRSAELLRTLQQVGDSLTALADGQWGQLVNQVQSMELIVAEVYRLAGFSDVAVVRLQLVIVMAPDTEAADQARQMLSELGQ